MQGSVAKHCFGPRMARRVAASLTPRIRPARGIVELFLLCAVLIAVVYGMAVYTGYRQHMQNATSVAQRLTGILAEHARQTIDTATAATDRITAEVEEHGLAAISSSDDVWDHVAGFTSTLPQLRSVIVLDAAARPVRMSDPGAPLTPAAAGHLVAAHRGKTAATRIDRVGVGSEGTANLVVSKGIPGADGGLSGVVVVVLNKSYFSDFYQTIDVGPGGTIGIAWDDGTLLARHPAAPSRLQDALPEIAAFSGAAGQMRTTISLIDGVERMVTNKRLPDLPLCVYTALDLDDVLAIWRAGLRVSAPVAACVGLILAALAWLLWRSAAREERLVGNLERALAEKNLLFQEIHHRVKNNLQVVSSLVAMQSAGMVDAETRDSLRDLVGRISSISLVHDVLYRHDEADGVELGSLLARLCEAVAAYHKADGRIAVEVDADCRLDLRRAVPLVLVANEVVANAFKHAFPDGRRGTIRVWCRTVAGRHVLRIRDDGVGYDAAAMHKDTLGTRLVAALVRQLGGTSSTAVAGGTTLEFSFPV